MPTEKRNKIRSKCTNRSIMRADAAQVQCFVLNSFSCVWVLRHRRCFFSQPFSAASSRRSHIGSFLLELRVWTNVLNLRKFQRFEQFLVGPYISGVRMLRIFKWHDRTAKNHSERSQIARKNVDFGVPPKFVHRKSKISSARNVPHANRKHNSIVIKSMLIVIVILIIAPVPPYEFSDNEISIIVRERDHRCIRCCHTVL